MPHAPGYKTTELLAAVLSSVAGWVATWAGTLSPKWAAIVMAASSVGYSLSRGLTKLGASRTVLPVVLPETTLTTTTTTTATQPTPPAGP